ncbi:MAG: hypothetical protein CM15mP22_0620 [Gammaproteobacteria bacterium]|nr:MAG: hypothetical protein CM15mP22_0620 [Gammaproteobacteria bacterium]
MDEKNFACSMNCLGLPYPSSTEKNTIAELLPVTISGLKIHNLRSIVSVSLKVIILSESISGG